MKPARALWLAVLLTGCGMADPDPVGEQATRGAARAAPVPAPGKTPAKGLSSARGGTDFFATPGAPPLSNTPPPPPTDGGLATDGGARVAIDQDLKVAVEAQGRSLASCFPPSLPNLPDVSIDFQISVSGMVTRAEVSAAGLDSGVSACVRRVAESVRFPQQASVRSFNYPLKLRRVDAGTPAPTKSQP